MSFSSTKRPPPVALNGSKKRQVYAAITQLEEQQRRLATINLTGPELMELFVDPNHHEPLRRAYQICEPTGNSYELYTEIVTAPVHGSQRVWMKWQWNGGANPDGFYVPYAMGSDDDRHANLLEGIARPGLVERYKQMRDDLIDLHFRFAQVKYVLNKLNDSNVCSTLPQMRYVWPAIVPLLRKGGFKEDADAIATASPRAGDGARVPGHLQVLLKGTSDTVSRAFMLEGHTLPPQPDIRCQLVHHFKTD